MPCSMAVFISGESLLDVEGLARADADPGETRHQFCLGRDRRAELQHEVQDVEELAARSSLLAGVSGLMKSMAGAALGAGWPRNAESGCTL